MARSKKQAQALAQGAEILSKSPSAATLARQNAPR
jgi:hypothetical protein